jgi:uncharacterized membrane protein YiaA
LRYVEREVWGTLDGKGDMRMPVNIIVGNIALIIALVLYSVGVWGAFRAKAFSGRHLTMIWLGVAFDIMATLMMAISAGGTLQWDTPANKLHTALALAAFLGMVGVAAAVSPLKVSEKARMALTRVAIAPWALWIGVYVFGLLTKMPKRG